MEHWTLARDADGLARLTLDRAGSSTNTLGAPVLAELNEALDQLDRDRAFLTKGGVFTDDMIDAYIGLKMEEVTRFRMTTHPIEFDMYFSL